MGDDDRIIHFPGSARPGDGGSPPRSGRQTAKPAPPAAPVDPNDLDEDQRKAISLVLSGTAFVMIGIKPTGQGADFYTAVHGDATDLRNALPHLGGVIERAFARKGI